MRAPYQQLIPNLLHVCDLEIDGECQQCRLLRAVARQRDDRARYASRLSLVLKAFLQLHGGSCCTDCVLDIEEAADAFDALAAGGHD